ncbi:MAG: thioredoxin domain-containing protein [Isosphaeraceae bacterium]
MRVQNSLPVRAACLVGLILSAMATGPAAGEDLKSQGPANRLARETSPYLLLHAHNPVDWYPWGPEAFARAKAEGKPIFLSVGYSSCYWCHVMERESFEDKGIARLLNERFVCVKVDREERPDVDQVYMTALQVFGGGGWPMSMFLTSDGRPFFGGTYYPPSDRDGMEGFPSILNRVIEAWRDQRGALEKDADRLANVVRRTLDSAAQGRRVPLSRQSSAAGVASLAQQFDPEYGGFGFNPANPRRPKFPEPVNLVFLLDQHRRAGNGMKTRSSTEVSSSDERRGGHRPIDMVVTTLDHMARGGIRDQLAGGYHRYATSRYWDVPHFEKMLYDNAQLASAHLLAFEQTGDPRWRIEAEATFAFVARTLTAPEGGFYSSLDAETQGEEGESYVWTRAEVKQILGEGPDHEAFAQVYGLNREPNFEKGRHVLLQPKSLAEQARARDTKPEALEARLAQARAKLLAVREKRPAPLCDDKILTSWNGLMIAAYADGFRVLKEPRYREAAEKGADFLLAKLRTSDGRLLRTYRARKAKLAAYLEDYAYLAHGLLRLHTATGDPKRLAEARALTERMIEDFHDPKAGGFFFTAGDHEKLIARPKDATDGVLPSGNSVAIRNLVALSVATREPRYLDLAGKALASYSMRLAQSPTSLPLMLVGMEEYLDARPETESPTAALSGEPSETNDVVTVAASVKEREKISPGQEFDVELILSVKKGWHTYANPAGVEDVLPSRVTLDPGQGATLVRVDYPKGEAKVLASSGKEKVSLYEGKTSLRARVKLNPSVATPPPALGFTVHYQACDDRSCLAPARLRVKAQLPVSPSR